MRNILEILIIVGVLCFTQLIKAEDSPTQDNNKGLKIKYSNSIMQHLKDNWEYRITPENKNESVVLMLRIDKSGKILERKVLKHSTEDELNKEVFKQLAAMEPFPKMPEEIGAEYIKFNHSFVPNAVVFNRNEEKDIDQTIKEVVK